MTYSYDQLPTKFDFTRYYLNQAAGGPTFPVFRARQRGGSFLTPLLKRHGIPFIRWLGKQAATLATGLGSTYVDKGRITKEDLKGMAKKQGKEVASSVLDKIKQQIGSGSMTHRRDARLSSLIPVSTIHREGALTNRHMIRGPSHKEQKQQVIPLPAPATSPFAAAGRSRKLTKRKGKQYKESGKEKKIKSKKKQIKGTKARNKRKKTHPKASVRKSKNKALGKKTPFLQHKTIFS